MASDNLENEEVDVADVAVPPILAEHEDQFLDSEGLFLAEKYARHAQEVSGIAGPIGVAIRHLKDVKHNLDVSASEGDMDSQSLIQTSLNILKEVADQHISDYDSPLYDKSDLESSSLIDRDQASSSGSTSPDNFARMSIDSINGKGNILARPDDLSLDHLHLSHGQVGDEVVVYLGSEIGGHSDGLQCPVLPFETEEESAENYSEDTILHLNEGDLLKLTNPQPIEEESFTVGIDGYNISEIEIDVEVPAKKQITVRIEEINGCTAQGRIEKSTTKPRHREKSKSRRRSRSSRYAGSGNNNNPFGDTGSNKNNLIRDNLR